MKLSDYVIDFLAKQGIRYNFVVSGGAVIHLVDSTRKHPDMDYICAQHEQNGAAAADLYARVSNQLGLTMTTSGPGATNILTSVCSAYFDSVPMICVTGQVARFRIKQTDELRQKGFQETDVISIFKSVTKYAKQVLDPLQIRYELEKAVYYANEGRKGPVLLDIPDDLQREEVNPDELRGFEKKSHTLTAERSELEKLVKLIAGSKRPVIVYGRGVHAARVEEKAIEFARQLNIPALLTWGAADLFTHDDPLNMGGLGVVGPRYGNFAVQTSDLVIALGTRLSQMITGGKQNLFAPNAKKVMVDVDVNELEKFNPETFELDLKIRSDLSAFFDLFKDFYPSFEKDRFFSWREQINQWKKDFPIWDPKNYKAEDEVHPVYFIKSLSHLCQEDETIVLDTGATICWTMQAFETKKGQTIHSAWNNTPMGFAVPASVGAVLGTDRRVVCISGDGGLMMCLEELGTVRRNNLPVIIFVFNNKGHGIQKQTCDTWLNSTYSALNEETGLFFPDYEKVSQAFSIPYVSIESNKEVKEKLLQVMEHKSGPIFCDVKIGQDHKIVPMLKFGSGLEDLFPKIPNATLENIMSLNQENPKMEKMNL